MTYILVCLPLSILLSLLSHFGIIIIDNPYVPLINHSVKFLIPFLGLSILLIGLIFHLNDYSRKENRNNFSQEDNLFINKLLKPLIPLNFIGLLILEHYWVAGSLIYAIIVYKIVQHSINQEIKKNLINKKTIQ